MSITRLGPGGYPIAFGAVPASNAILAAEGTYSLTGESAALNLGRKLTAAQGTYSLTGEAAIPAVGMPAAEGTYALTGKAVIFTKNSDFSAAEGTYALTGKAVSFAQIRGIAAAEGSYSLTGEAVSFPTHTSVLGNGGAYSLAGQDVSFINQDEILADPGAYSLSGVDVAFVFSFPDVGSGTYNLNGQPQDLARLYFGGFSSAGDFPVYEVISNTMAGYLIGNTVGFRATFLTVGGIPVEPNLVTLTLQDPDGTQYTPAVSNPQTGLFNATFGPGVVGQWIWRWTGTGVVEAAAEGVFTIYDSLQILN